MAGTKGNKPAVSEAINCAESAATLRESYHRCSEVLGRHLSSVTGRLHSMLPLAPVMPSSFLIPVLQRSLGIQILRSSYMTVMSCHHDSLMTAGIPSRLVTQISSSRYCLRPWPVASRFSASDCLRPILDRVGSRLPCLGLGIRLPCPLPRPRNAMPRPRTPPPAYPPPGSARSGSPWS